MEDKQESKNNQDHTAPTPTPPVALNPPANPPSIPLIDGLGAASPRGDETPRNLSPPLEDKLTKNDIVMIVLTTFIALGTIVSAVAIGFQWHEMHEGGKDTHDLAVAAGKQADAAKAQSDESVLQVRKMTESLGKTDALIKEATAQAVATNRLAEQAQRSAEYAQEAIKTSVESDRPWVGISTYRVDNFVEGQTAKIIFNITNSGKRPASSRAIYQRTIVKSLPAFPSVTNNQTSVAYILPGATFSATLPYDIPTDAFSEWKRNKEIFFILSEIVYTDVGTNESYITHFCAFYDPSNKDQPFPLCTRYNEAR